MQQALSAALISINKVFLGKVDASSSSTLTSKPLKYHAKKKATMTVPCVLMRCAKFLPKIPRISYRETQTWCSTPLS